MPSDSFTLPRDRDHLKVDAKMGSSYGRLGGIGLTVMGAGGVLLGATAVVLTPIFASQDVGSGTFRTGPVRSANIEALGAAKLGIVLIIVAGCGHQD